MKNPSTSADRRASSAAQSSDTMMLGESSLGDVKIHDGVIATLSRRAALSVDGVSRLAGNSLVDNLAEIVGSRRMQSRAVTVAVDEANAIIIEIKINLKSGFVIPEIAESVQKAIIAAVENVTGMTVKQVHVLVQDIDDPSEENAEENGEAYDEDRM